MFGRKLFLIIFFGLTALAIGSSISFYLEWAHAMKIAGRMSGAQSHVYLTTATGALVIAVISTYISVLSVTALLFTVFWQKISWSLKSPLFWGYSMALFLYSLCKVVGMNYGVANLFWKPITIIAEFTKIHFLGIIAYDFNNTFWFEIIFMIPLIAGLILLLLNRKIIFMYSRVTGTYLFLLMLFPTIYWISWKYWSHSIEETFCKSIVILFLTIICPFLLVKGSFSEQL